MAYENTDLDDCIIQHTVKILKIRTPEFAVITLKFEKVGFTHRVMHPKGADGMANSVDPS